MPNRRGSPGRGRPGAPRPPVRRQVSAGGVVLRQAANGVEVVAIRPAGTQRWQLPKGIVDSGEAPEATARREVREEAGVHGEVIAPLDEVEYWYAGTDRDGVRVRFHKTVHFFLMRFLSGDVRDHDREVDEARWVPIAAAIELLAFRNEKRAVEKAGALLRSGVFDQNPGSDDSRLAGANAEPRSDVPGIRPGPTAAD